ncbi:MAG: hypothetical protein ABSB13_04800 [Candidatus Binatus sp.]|jgi:hypothetical protein|uniref:hypothetical protein n=1 Tax=Candidatus Binatus sp. TaxID=2811406 RepID=UPI003D098968
MGKLKVLGIIAAVLALSPVSVLAGNSDKLATCNAAADLAREITKQRDSGISSDALRASVATLAPKLRNIGEALITQIYGETLTPDQEAAATLNGCLAKGEHD